MYCPWCAKENVRTDVCEGCNLPMQVHARAVVSAPAAAPVYAGQTLVGQPLGGQPMGAQPLATTQAMPAAPQPMPGGAPQGRYSLTGEFIAEPPPMPTQAMPAGPLQPGMAPPAPPPPGAYMAGRTAGLPATAMSPTMFKDAGDTPSLGERWEKCLAIALPILAISILGAHFTKDFMGQYGITLGAMFAIALAMGGTCAIGSYDDNYLDIGVVMGITWFFGPLIGLVGYVIQSLIRQEFNATIPFLLIAYEVVVFCVGLSHGLDGIIYGFMMSFKLFGGWFSTVAMGITFFGWFLSNFFRPVNDF